MIYLNGKKYTEEELKNQLFSIGYRLEKMGVYEKKMTREEAINVCKSACKPRQGWSEINIQALSDLLSCLKALGLIKFEEEKKEENFKYNTPVGEIYWIDNHELINHLRKQGYTVTKNG